MNTSRSMPIGNQPIEVYQLFIFLVSNICILLLKRRWDLRASAYVQENDKQPVCQ